jgi:NTP pyrophosphatase (non-canonical NTP hydrolase)
MNKEQYLLICLAEEAGEVIQCITKCLRFTTSDHHPSRERTNLDELEFELRDFFTILTLLEHEIGIEFDTTFSDEKMNKLDYFSGISKKMGVLDE